MYSNAILAALHQSSNQTTLPLRPVTFQHGTVLAEGSSAIEDVIFPEAGLISLVVRLASGEKIEAGMVGRDGVIGAAAAFGTKAHICSAFAQIRGHGWLMRAADLRRIVRQNPELDTLLISGEQHLTAQAQQMSACGARHHLGPRICSWLLRASDIVGAGEVEITQEHMSEMLGVQRASVSVLAAQMQEDGLIHYRRGRVSIVDRAGLRQRACECYGALQGKRDLLFAVDSPVLQADGTDHSAPHRHNSPLARGGFSLGT